MKWTAKRGHALSVLSDEIGTMWRRSSRVHYGPNPDTQMFIHINKIRNQACTPNGSPFVRHIFVSFKLTKNIRTAIFSASYVKSITHQAPYHIKCIPHIWTYHIYSYFINIMMCHRYYQSIQLVKRMSGELQEQVLPAKTQYAPPLRRRIVTAHRYFLLEVVLAYSCYLSSLHSELFFSEP